MKLWSGVLSPFSAKVRMALGEKQLEYETLTVPWSRKGAPMIEPTVFRGLSDA